MKNSIMTSRGCPYDCNFCTVTKMFGRGYRAQSPQRVIDEISGYKNKKELLEEIVPPYIILKPTLLGGFKESEEWIHLAKNLGIEWWITSALESNIGLNAIAQWAATLKSNMYQGLGTGALYTNNINCPLVLKGDQLYYSPEGNWDITTI